MRGTHLTLMLFGLFSCKTVAPVSDVSTVGGVKADLKKTPKYILQSAVGLRATEDSDCSGVLVHPKIVLTARHCVDVNLVVYFGIDKKTAPKLNGLLTHRHRSKDLALILLEKDAPKEYVPIKLFEKEFVPSKGRQASLAGYGVFFVKDKRGTWDESEEDVLQVVDLPFDLTHAELDMFSKIANDEGYDFDVAECKDGSHLCFVGQGLGAHSGDSGGPVYDPESKTLIGITSQGLTPMFQADLKFQHRTVEGGRFLGYTTAVALRSEQAWVAEGIKKLLAVK